jgi:hypothetical protein
MSGIRYRGRQASSIENDKLRVTVLVEGGHIAEILDKRSGVNPLWTPGWPSIEPSTFGVEHHSVYGSGSDGRLLAGIMGHNLCLDLFGGPSPEEAASGLTTHGEASVMPYTIESGQGILTTRAEFPLSALGFIRRIELHGSSLRISETLSNRSACDRPIAWTQHFTLGPPFLQKGVTEFRASVARSKVFEDTFGPADYLRAGAVFDWPMAPRADGAWTDLRRFTDDPSSSAYTTHLMNPALDQSFFVAFSPAARLAFGYVWQQVDFPWLGIWEENKSRSGPPWNGEALTCGMEFGVSPIPETRRAMIDRHRLFDVATYRWIPAGSTIEVEYWVIVQETNAIPDVLVPAR